MCQVNVLEAKTSFSKLLALLENEEEDEVVIARNGKPVARLVRWTGPEAGARIGTARGLFAAPEDLDADDQFIASLFTGEGS